MPGQLADLGALAPLWGVQPGYRDYRGKRRLPSPPALVAILAALGAPLADPADASEALRQRRLQTWQRVLEPVVVAWDGRLRTLDLRLPVSAAGGPVAAVLTLEDGSREDLTLDLDQSRRMQEADLEGLAFVAVRATVGRRLPLGYHRLRIQAPGGSHEALVIAAPRHAYVPPEASGPGRPPHRMWGPFAPVHALHAAGNLGIGDLGDLAGLLDWVGGLGGDVVGTLPLLACFLDQPFEPSPYSPVSRRFWNEIFIDVAALPEVAQSADAQAALAAASAAAGSVLPGSLVDYRRVAAAKRRVLEAGAVQLLAGGSARRDALERYAGGHPDLDVYAAFRAAGESYGTPWQRWPEPARAGNLAGVGSAEARRYHRYVQFAAHCQMDGLARGGRPGLLLDLPLGVHPGGYDVWRARDAFLLGTTAGAPPDPLNATGQNWGNPPLHPEGIRRSGHAYTIASIRHLLAHSRVLRIDHVMGLHRLFVLPETGTPGDGAYVRYQAAEGYAILCLESHRAGALIVGEDLGTVPGYVRKEMAGHRIHRCYVAQWAIPRDPSQGLEPVPEDVIASINTHDMAPFSAFWRGIDIAERRSLGLLTEAQAGEDEWRRGEDRAGLVAGLVAEGLLEPAAAGEAAEAAVLDAWLAWIGRSRARVALVTLEDLWAETRSQNLPGTVDEHPNWRRRMALTLEELRCSRQVVGRLEVIAADRSRQELAGWGADAQDGAVHPPAGTTADTTREAPAESSSQ